MSNGEPQRSMESPVAWPSYKGFPPDRDPVTKKAIDYALKPHGGRFALTLTLALALALALTLALTLTLTRALTLTLTRALALTCVLLCWGIVQKRKRPRTWVRGWGWG